MRQTKIVVTRYGGPEVITVAEKECPAPMPGEVRVKVLAAGVSLPDVLACDGVHPETGQQGDSAGQDPSPRGKQLASGQTRIRCSRNHLKV